MKANLWIPTNAVKGAQLNTMSYFQTEMIWPVQWAEKCRKCLKRVIHNEKFLRTGKTYLSESVKDQINTERNVDGSRQYTFFLKVCFKESQVWKEISLCLLIHILSQIYLFQVTNAFRKSLYTTITVPGRTYRLKFNS